MRVLTSDETRAGPAGRCAVTVGVYDGLHKGHRWLLRKLRQQARQHRLETAVVTFDPHPLQVLRPVAAPKMLTDLDQRLRLLEETGLADHCFVLRFDAERSRQAAAEFVAEVLVDRLRAATVITGEGFRFGHNRAGDTRLLEELGGRYGFETLAVPLLPASHARPDAACSSTLVRSLVVAGDVESAARFLGRAHKVTGTVVGTSLPSPGRGVPTVVVRVPPDRCLPAEGAFGGRLVLSDGRELPCGIAVRAGADWPSGQLLHAHVPGDMVPGLMDQAVHVRFARRLWAAAAGDLLEDVRQDDEAMQRARAFTGWAASL